MARAGTADLAWTLWKHPILTYPRADWGGGGTVGHCFCRVDMGPDPRHGRGTLSSVRRKGSRSPQEDGCLGSVGGLALATLDSGFHTGFHNRRIRHAAAGTFAIGRLDFVAIQAQGSLRCAAVQVQVCVPGVGLSRLASICTQHAQRSHAWSGSLRNFLPPLAQCEEGHRRLGSGPVRTPPGVPALAVGQPQ